MDAAGWLYTGVSIRENVSGKKNGFIPLYLTLPFLLDLLAGYLAATISLGSLFFPLNPSTPALHKPRYPLLSTLAFAMRKCSWGKWMSRSTYGKWRPGNGCCKCGGTFYSVPCALLEMKDRQLCWLVCEWKSPLRRSGGWSKRSVDQQPVWVSTIQFTHKRVAMTYLSCIQVPHPLCFFSLVLQTFVTLAGSKLQILSQLENM